MFEVENFDCTEKSTEEPNAVYVETVMGPTAFIPLPTMPGSSAHFYRASVPVNNPTLIVDQLRQKYPPQTTS